MLLWSLIIVTLTLCAISFFPTKWCVGFGRWLAGLWHRHRVGKLEREMARRAAGTSFAATMSFLPQGVGLAFDPARKMLFLAEESGSGLVSEILPFAALRQVSTGEAAESGCYDFYVDLTVRDRAKSKWRLLCGGNFALAQEVKQALLEGAGVARA